MYCVGRILVYATSWAYTDEQSMFWHGVSVHEVEQSVLTDKILEAAVEEFRHVAYADGFLSVLADWQHGQMGDVKAMTLGL